jgi:hypothetical protein
MRRRCGWCAVLLRWWQWGHCKLCAPYFRNAGLYRQSSGPPGPYLSRRDAEPDRWRSQIRS